MNFINKIPTLSVLMLLASYAAFGWLLSAHQADWRIWISSGAIAFGAAWLLAIGWAVAAILLVFLKQSQALFLSIGITAVWAMLMYVARVELQAFTNSKVAAFFTMTILAAIGLGLGWYADLSLIRNIGASIIKV
jgi:hypothetical protein